MEPAGDPQLEVSAEGPHWFDINDSQVEPIQEADIEKQFQGKESAYMLFYRKTQLQRPPEGMGHSIGASAFAQNSQDQALAMCSMWQTWEKG